MNPPKPSQRALLAGLATRAMLERGLRPTFSAEALAELSQIRPPDVAAALKADPAIRDLRGGLWASVDNDDSRDLDQLSMAEALPTGQTRIWVAVADVDVLVPIGSALDEQAGHNTSTVYTPAMIFSMLPERLSTDLTSLNEGVDRLAMVVEMVIDAQGALQSAEVYRAAVCNRAKLAYNSLAAWLDGDGPLPAAASAVDGLDEVLQLQDRAGQRMSLSRRMHGALTLETVGGWAVFEDDILRAMEFDRKNRATQMVENFMIAANGATARFLASHKFASIRRVVLEPQRWDRIVELAGTYGVKLPGAPNSLALEEFLLKQKALDRLRFPDLSLTIVKLLGAGEYMAELPDDPIPDHFGLAARDYTHSTAPNRRYPDLITQRLLKAALAGQPTPYPLPELHALAEHCTQQEDDVNKVERQASKSAVALLLSARIGQRFEALVTGASPKGTWVRLLDIPVEGRLAADFSGLDVGDRVRVELTAVEIERGFIDFKRRK